MKKVVGVSLMLQIESIILYCLKQLNSERTIYSIYHLLNGKKASQTIQDAHLFSLKSFFGIYEPLTRESFDELIQSMLGKRWIYSCGEQRYLLMPSGMSSLENNPLPYYLNGWTFHQFTTLFWERLSMFVQVTSNLVFEETRYTPIQRNKDVHLWLKSLLKNINIQRKEMSGILYSELIECFDEVKEADPSLLVFRLTGFQQIGLTPLQVANKLIMNIHDYQIGFINTLHYLIQKIEREPNRFRVLSFLIDDLKQDDELTLSSRKTRNLLNRGYSLEKIARLRHLKLSTIEDHLVEFALNIDGFPIDTYVGKELQIRIVEISRQATTRELKVIREKLKTASYFQIRLVMAKYGDR
jgi:uncharacterized protein YpbB